MSTQSTLDEKGLRNYFLKMSQEEGIAIAQKELMSFLKDSYKELHKEGLDVFLKFRGQLGEILLEIYLLEYIKHNPSCFYVKGLCVEKTEKGGYSDYTELDVTLFTPSQVILFECKCYAGEKTLTDRCTIEREGKEPMDVAGQSVAHLKHLVPHTAPFKKEVTHKHKPYKVALFELSMDSTVDSRADADRIRFPYLTANNIQSFLDNLPTGEYFNQMKLYSRIVKLNKDSESNFKKHLKQMEASKR